VTVRVIEYRLQGRSNQVYRLVTTILDPQAAPAVELAALYAQRWEIASAFGEWKTYQRGKDVVLRSKSSEGWSRRSGRICWSTTRYAILWQTPPRRPIWIPIGCRF
jgi:hypothetical protein